MSRKRQPQYDYICRTCGCICNASGTKHTGGGPGMKSCGRTPVPILRSEFQESVRADLAGLRERPRYHPEGGE